MVFNNIYPQQYILELNYVYQASIQIRLNKVLRHVFNKYLYFDKSHIFASV